ncbi:MAG: DUF4177 domain-containing protein [Bifidobacteriaceae bacterium]|jgi:hypothetical protein|nr:DUF4177 domain-containing protein [Bifidobacteriaceae bacterium]
MMYEYLVVAVGGGTGTRLPGRKHVFIQTEATEVMNDYAKQGWEVHQVTRSDWTGRLIITFRKAI